MNPFFENKQKVISFKDRNDSLKKILRDMHTRVRAIVDVYEIKMRKLTEKNYYCDHTYKNGNSALRKKTGDVIFDAGRKLVPTCGEKAKWDECSLCRKTFKIRRCKSKK